MSDEFPFIQNVVDFFHDFVAALNPDADVDGARTVLDVVRFAGGFQPVGPASSRRNDGFVCIIRHVNPVFGYNDAFALVVFDDEILNVGVEDKLHAAL